MRFSQTAGVAIVPTLARLVLAAAFIPVGFNKLFTTAEFDPGQAAILEHYGVKVTPAADDEVAAREAGVARHLLLQEAEIRADPPDEAASGAAPEGANEADPTPAGRDSADSVPPVIEPLAPGIYQARAMHSITLLCHGAGWVTPGPQWMALVAALTELVGGALLLVGLFSRIWGLGLAIAMGVAFHLVSVRLNGVLTTSPFAFAQDIPKFSTACAQLGLFVLAFGVCLTGPGPLSIDRFLAGRRESRGHADPEPAPAPVRSVPAPRPPAPAAALPRESRPVPPPRSIPLEAEGSDESDDRPDPPPSQGGRPL